MASGPQAKLYGTDGERYVSTHATPASWAAQPEMANIFAGVRALLRDHTPHEIRPVLGGPPVPIPESVSVSERFAIPRVPLAAVPDGLFVGSVGRRAQTMPLEAEWVVPGALKDMDKSRELLVYFHGGGYIVGAATKSRGYPLLMAQKHGIQVLNVEYALAPEDPFPAAVIDAMSVLKFAADQGFAAEKIVITGDSAGGGLSYAVALALRDFGEEMGIKGPGGIAALTPYVDLSLTSPTMLLGSFLPSSIFSLCALCHMACRPSCESYAGAKFPFAANLLASSYFCPVNDTKPGLPPQYIFTGGADTLLAEDILLALRRTRLGDSVQLQVWEEMPHDPHLIIGPPIVIEKSLASVAAFIKAVADGEKIESSMGSFDSITGEKTEWNIDDAVARLKRHAEEAKAAGILGEVAGADEAAEMYAKGL